MTILALCSSYTINIFEISMIAEGINPPATQTYHVYAMPMGLSFDNAGRQLKNICCYLEIAFSNFSKAAKIKLCICFELIELSCT